jgi:hypothetical protein
MRWTLSKSCPSPDGIQPRVWRNMSVRRAATDRDRWLDSRRHSAPPSAKQEPVGCMREWPRLTSAADLGPKRGGFADSRPRFSDTDFRDLRLARRTWPTWSSRLGSAVRRSEPIGGRVGRRCSQRAGLSTRKSPGSSGNRRPGPPPCCASTGLDWRRSHRLTRVREGRRCRDRPADRHRLRQAGP